ncbi:MAG: phosphotransferase family protein [Deltaproteobacteria bacterium]|jgi:aminoglycoside phosphotransferase (APT) family kinase protein|nr:phosphotransferase family protein [Deltaproteobacteria bacterium]
MAQNGEEREIEGIDLPILEAWMDEQGLPEGPIGTIDRLKGGSQNILIRFERGGHHYVLRRPPIHKRATSDETMRREARVLAALAETDVPHPLLVAACPDEALLGAAFYLMEPVDGFNATQGLPELHAGDREIRHGMGLAMADGIAALAAVDYQAVGLEDFGRPEGYLERQVTRWRGQLESYSELEGYPGPQIPGVDRVAEWLDRHRPEGSRPGILHGDYHIANVMFRFDGPELAAIVDWELATVGDPLLDLGALLVNWPDEEAGPPVPIHRMGLEGLPTPSEMLERYRERSTRSLDALDWYRVLACYRLGIILEGTYARAWAGQADRQVGDLLHATTVSLFERALTLI